VKFNSDADESGCWIWRGFKDSDGYGRISTPGPKHTAAHRASLEFALGRSLSGHALHHCDNPACVNPNHLYEGTDADNSRDKLARQRQARGAKILRCRLTESAVRSIKNDNRRNSEIARDHGVATSTVHAVKAGRSWAYI
jgi:hypothetical protein